MQKLSTEGNHAWVLVRTDNGQVTSGELFPLPRCPRCASREFVYAQLVPLCMSPAHPPGALADFVKAAEAPPVGEEEKKREIGFKRNPTNPPTDADAVPRRPDTGTIREE